MTTAWPRHSNRVKRQERPTFRWSGGAKWPKRVAPVRIICWSNFPPRLFVTPLLEGQPHSLTAEQAAPAFYGPLEQYAVVHFSGADALAFLQGQLTCDVIGLPADRWVWAGYCTAKGRLLCTGILWREGNSACLILPASQADAMAKRLRMFVLRAKVTISVTGEDRQLIGMRLPVPDGIRSIPALRFPSQAHQCLISPDHTALRLAGDCGLTWIPTAAAKTLREGQPTGSPSAWDAVSVGLDEPWLAPASQELYVPQMLNLERIGGVSFTKGCYPGQEIVARSQHLGQVKRRLYRYRAEATRLPVIGTRIVGHDAKPAGEVLRAASLDGHRCLLLAVIPTEMQDQALTLEDGTPLHAETPTHAAS